MDSLSCINNKILASSSKSTIRSISISADDKILAIGQLNDNNNGVTLSLIDIETGKCIDVLEKSENNTNSVLNVIFDRKEKDIVYYVSQIGTEYLYNFYDFSKKEKKILQRTVNKNIVMKLSLDFSENLLIPDRDARLLNFNNKEIINDIKIDLASIIKNVQDVNKSSMILSPSGKEIAITNTIKGKILIYNIEENKIRNELIGKFNYIEALYYDPNDKFVLAIKENNQLIAWDLNKNNLHLESKCEYINGILSININRKYELFSVGMITPYIIIFDINSGKRLYKDELQNGRVYDVCFTNDGQKLISAGEDGKIVIRELNIL